MKNLKYMIIAYLIIQNVMAFAGGWHSGGAELIKDSSNPWFLSNTSTVSYCIMLDEKNFGANATVVKKQLRKALSFWKNQFEYALLSDLPMFGELQIASQVFTESDCGPQTDLFFQFGILSQEQKDFLKDPTRFAAVTVRTHYDTVNLRGKGFIYTSPSSGPLAFQQDGVIENAWGVDGGNLLYLTLVHELGHVFGLQHMGSYGDLMFEGYVESILHKKNNIMSSDVNSLSFFSFRNNFPLICPDQLILSKWQTFFGVSPQEKCFSFEFKHDANNMFFGKTLMRVLSSSSRNSQAKFVLEIELEMYKFFPAFTSIIWLPQGQNVFSEADMAEGVGSGILGAVGLSVSKKGIFKTSSSDKDRLITVRFQQGKETLFIDGMVDYDVIPLL